MPSRRATLLPRHEILAFVLAGLLALAVVALSGWGGDPEDAGSVERDGRVEATPVAVPTGVPSVDP